ncbi:kinase-like domain-containing protein [Aspergillus karnatakaensis]|uniref:kinase-like domain-containing protein n=1 Tax=Aspergillus karnatakaensis TaxID=1810916 RepID=UPI003CCD1F40
MPRFPSPPHAPFYEEPDYEQNEVHGYYHDLSDLCAPPRNWVPSDLQIFDGYFKRIAERLRAHRGAGDGWAKRPRLYTVLRNVGCLHLFDSFIAGGINDSHLPLEDSTLQRFIGDQALRKGFLRHQIYLGTEAQSLEKGGPHMVLETEEDVYFEFLDQLGRGQNSVVDRVLSQLSLSLFARKKVPIRHSHSDSSCSPPSNVRKQLKELKGLSHHHLVRYVGSYTQNSHIAFIMTPVADTNLRTHLVNCDPRTDAGANSLRNLFGCLAAAVQYLHRNKIVHGDLNPLNILVLRDQALISDFGSITKKPSDAWSISHTSNPAWNASFYVAPEVLNIKPDGMRSDMWSLGLVYLEIISVLLGQPINSTQELRVSEWITRLEGSQEIRPGDDKEPLGWIKGLHKDHPADRLTADALVEKIRLSSVTHAFYCSLCRPHYAPYSPRDPQAPVQVAGPDTVPTQTAFAFPPGHLNNQIHVPVPALPPQIKLPMTAEEFMKQAWEKARTQSTTNTRVGPRCISLNRYLELHDRYLEFFCQQGNCSAVRYLLDRGCNPGKRSRPRPDPLLNAVRGGTLSHYRCLQALLDRNVEVNVQDQRSGKTALHLALEAPGCASYTKIVYDLVFAGANTNIADGDGEFPIHAIFKPAAPDSSPAGLEECQLEALAIILQSDIAGGPNVNIPHPNGRSSPLHLAVQRTSPYAVAMLLHKGADVNMINSENTSPLLAAAMQWSGPLTHDQTVMLELLLNMDDIQLDRASGTMNRTALHFAALARSQAAFDRLVRRGADQSITDIQGRTALDILGSEIQYSRVVGP